MTAHYIPSRSQAIPAIYDHDHYDERMFDYIENSSADIIEFGVARAFTSTPPPAVAKVPGPTSGANP